MVVFLLASLSVGRRLSMTMSPTIEYTCGVAGESNRYSINPSTRTRINMQNKKSIVIQVILRKTKNQARSVPPRPSCGENNKVMLLLPVRICGTPLVEPILGKNFKHPPRPLFQPKIILDKSLTYVSRLFKLFCRYNFKHSISDPHLRSLSSPSTGGYSSSENSATAEEEETLEIDPGICEISVRE